MSDDHPDELIDGSNGPSLDAECFFITPIGGPDSPQRRRADGILATVVAPAAESNGLTAVRADRIAAGGNISFQVIEHCVGAKMAVADLTGSNPNVLYEVGIRHAFRQPLILIADSEGGSLPSDLLQQRTTFYVNDMAGVVDCREAVTGAIAKALTGHIDSPVDSAASLERLSGGSDTEKLLAALVERVDRLGSELAVLRRVTKKRARPRPAEDVAPFVVGLDPIAEGDRGEAQQVRLRALQAYRAQMLRDAKASKRTADGTEVDGESVDVDEGGPEPAAS